MLDKKQTILLIIIIGLILYTVCSNNTENFQDCDCSNENSKSKPVRSVISKVSGVGVNVCSANSIDCTTGDLNSDYLVLVNQNALVVLPDGSFSTMSPNGNDKNQLWSLVKVGEDEYKVQWKQSGDKKRVLQYENGSLSVRLSGNYNSQLWHLGYEPITNFGVPIVGSSKETQMTPEYVGNVNSIQNVNQMNLQQNENVMKMFKKIMTVLDENDKLDTPKTHTLANKPLTLNIKLGGSGKVIEDVVGRETFNNGPASLLEEYENDNKKTQEKIELENLINGNNDNGCKIPNLDNYVHKSELAQCNGCANL